MIRTGDPPDELPNETVRSPKGGPKIVTPARNQQVDVMVQAEALVASAAERVPVRAGRSLRDELASKVPIGVGVGVAAGLAIRAAARGFAGGGFHFPSVFDPRQAARVR